MDEDLGTGVPPYGSGHGRLGLSLRAFHSLLGGGLLAFKCGGCGLNTLLDARKCTFSLGALGGGGGLGGQGSSVKLSHTLQIFTRRFNDPHSAIGINNAQHIIHKTMTHWGEGHIRKKTLVIHH